MKTVNKIVTLMVIVGMMTGCTQRRYSHVTGSQMNKKSKTEKTNHSGHYVSQQNTKPEVRNFSEIVPTAETSQVTKVSARMDKQIVYKSAVKTSDIKKVRGNEEVGIAIIPAIVNVQQSVRPKNVVNKVKTVVANKTKEGGLIYWILVLVLLLLIVALLESILGQGLTRLLILVLLLAFVGHLLGLW